ncbi:MAG: LptF/LptG family permease [Saprospiraceae bacterium]
MLKILDRYIIIKMLSTFLFTMLIFTMISVVIDFSEKVRQFIEEPITIKEIILVYYPNFILYINGLLLPLFSLIAVVFFTSRLAFNSEIISILNAGISFKRLMRPYIIGATIIGSFSLLANHWLIPEGNKIRLNIEHTYIHKNDDKGMTRNVHLFTNPNTKVYIKNWRKIDSTAQGLHIEEYQDNQLVFLLRAESAEWMGAPNHWKISDYEIRKFDGNQEKLIEEEKVQLDTTIDLTPADFIDYLNQQTMMNTRELNEYIANQKARGVSNTRKYEVEKHRRSTDAYTIIILTVIGMSIAGRKVRGGMGLHLALGVGIGAAYIFLSRFATVFATGYALPVILGIWIPNLVFTLIAYIIVSKSQR